MSDALRRKIDKAANREVKMLKEDEELEEEIENKVDRFIDRLEEKEEELIDKLDYLKESYEKGADPQAIAQIAAEISDNIHTIQDELEKLEPIGNLVVGGEAQSQIDRTIEDLDQLDELLAEVMQEAQS